MPGPCKREGPLALLSARVYQFLGCSAGINPATGKALGAIWVPSVPQNGVLADPRVIVNRDIAHNDVGKTGPTKASQLRPRGRSLCAASLTRLTLEEARPTTFSI